ncbi:MAG: amino acid permease [Gammaproteobacteria bacterium]|nr:amino acid permease [Gammaproteobacteria bacterium]
MAAHFGLLTLTALVVANMIGAGVFTTAGFALADLHTPARVLAAWAVGGVLALAGALSYAALARRLTESGGEYLFLSRALHPAAGYVGGWVSLLAGFTGAIAFAASALEAYLVPAAVRPDWLPPDTIAIGVVVVAGLAHGRSVTLGARAQNLLVAIKLVLILAVIAWATSRGVAGAWQGGPLREPDGTIAPFDPLAFAQSVMWVSLSYSGFNAAVYVAGEARDAAHQVPRAMIAGTVLVTAVYLALNAVFVLAPPPQAVAGVEDVAGRALGALGGAPLETAVRAIVALALASSVSSLIMAGPRVYARMAEDGVLPRWLSGGDGAPGAAIAMQVGLAVVVIRVTGIEALLSYLGFTLALSAALTVASLFVLRTREGAVAVPAAGYPWVPALYVGATLVFAALAAWRRPLEPLVGLATIALGLLAWWLTARQAR